MAFSDISLYTLIDDYSHAYEVKSQSAGTYEAGGVFKPSNDIWVVFEGVITNLTPQDFRADTMGVFTTEDRNLLSTFVHKIGTIVKYNDGNEYKILSSETFSRFAEAPHWKEIDDDERLYIYKLKREGRMKDSE